MLVLGTSAHVHILGIQRRHRDKTIIDTSIADACHTYCIDIAWHLLVYSFQHLCERNKHMHPRASSTMIPHDVHSNWIEYRLTNSQ